MKMNGNMELPEGAVVKNFTLAGGSAYPDLPEQGELFYHTANGLSVYGNDTWNPVLVNGSPISWSTIINHPTTIAGYGITDIPTAAVASVAGKTGDVVLSKTDVGLSNVDNTADLDKPVSTQQASAISSAQAAAIAASTPISHVGSGGNSHAIATQVNAGFLSSADKTKLDGIQDGATAYVHPTGDGSLHVPATGTTNNGKVLMAGATAGSLSWASVGTVTSVTGTAPIVSSGGTTPAISIPAATSSVSGYLTATDWSTFNSKQPSNANLTALSSIANGIIVQRAAGPTSVSILGTANQIAVANGDAQAGSPTVSISTDPILPGTGKVTFPAGTTAQRPAIAVNGDGRYNTTIGAMEFYQNNTWVPLGGAVPGSVAQTFTGAIAQQTGNTVIPYDNTVPLATEGTQIWTQAITPKSTTSRIGISFTVTADASANNRTLIIAVFRGTACIAAIVNEIDTSSHPKNMTLVFVDTPASTSAQTYSARIGIDSASANWAINGTISGNNLGGVLTSNYRVDEIL